MGSIYISAIEHNMKIKLPLTFEDTAFEYCQASMFSKNVVNINF